MLFIIGTYVHVHTHTHTHTSTHRVLAHEAHIADCVLFSCTSTNASSRTCTHRINTNMHTWPDLRSDIHREAFSDQFESYIAAHSVDRETMRPLTRHPAILTRAEALKRSAKAHARLRAPQVNLAAKGEGKWRAVFGTEDVLEPCWIWESACVRVHVHYKTVLLASK
jgi:hypothetical protein